MKDSEGVPMKRNRWSSSAVIQTAKEAGLEVSSKEDALEEIGKRVSSWEAFIGRLKVELFNTGEEDTNNPLDLIDRVIRLKDHNERLKTDILSYKGRYPKNE